MLVSILSRVTGVGLAIVGVGCLVWWLAAAASGEESYVYFVSWATWKWALIVPVGLSWALFQHTLSGMRHFVLDIGAGYELETNKFWAIMTLVGALLLTAALWGFIYWRAGA